MRTARAIVATLALAVTVVACGEDADIEAVDTTTTVAPSTTTTLAPAATVPEAPPDIAGTITSVAPFVPITEDCTPPEDLDPDGAVSSDDPPVCSDPDTDVVGTILVEEVPGEQTGRKISFTVTRSTVLVGSDGAPLGSFGDLAEGQSVDGWSTGMCAESYPEQCSAAALRRTA